LDNPPNLRVHVGRGGFVVDVATFEFDESDLHARARGIGISRNFSHSLP
jgi:hypothetical protein